MEFFVKVHGMYSEKARKFEIISQFYLKLISKYLSKNIERYFFKLLWPSQNIRTLLGTLLLI